MLIPELFTKGRPVFSFEFFLPKAPEDMGKFKETVRELKSLGPDFVTITYGAGGSGREQTIETAGMIKAELGLETASHLTCVAHTKAEIRAVLARLKTLRIENVVALRGDSPKDGSALPVERRELPYAADLVRLVRAEGGFAMAVAGYPEKHPEAASPEADLARLKEKVDGGGDWVITQLFFDNKDYFDFVRRARAAGVTRPIVPGIMPVTGYAQTKRFTEMCGAKLPPALLAGLAPIAEDKEAVVRFGVEWATRQCRELLAGGAPGVHFYTLNRSHSTEQVLQNLRRG
ncbi:MAG: methylenetetrahydrofolate reductase (NADPH) [Elusimicrobia bacterium]|nr:MAG: methylenetetrahydrofolate reductase (NADPH) [Elusimicrobiota bacterium]